MLGIVHIPRLKTNILETKNWGIWVCVKWVESRQRRCVEGLSVVLSRKRVPEFKHARPRRVLVST